MEMKRLIDIMAKYDSDFLINPDDIAFYDRLFMLQSPYGIIGLVFADCLQDAIDQAVDAGKMKYFEVEPEDVDQFAEDDISYLGNYGKPHLIDELFAEELT